MPWTTSLAIYFIIWWLVFFAALPWGVRSPHEQGDDIAPGTDPGAPAVHTVWMKLLWTTVIASVVFGVMAAVYLLGLIPYDFLAAISGPHH